MPVTAEVGPHERPIPVDSLEDDLAFGRTVENHALIAPEFAGCFDHAPGRLDREQGTQMGVSRAGFHERAVADDEMGVAWQLLGDPAGRVEPSARDDHDLDAARGSFSDG